MRLLMLAVLSVSIFLQFGCSGGTSGMELLRNYENKLQYRGETSIDVENLNGEIKVIAKPGISDTIVSAELKVTANSYEDGEAFLDMIEIIFAREGASYKVKSKVPVVWTMKSKAKKPKSWSVDYEITIPEGMDVNVSMTNGDAIITGANANVVGQTTNGNVSIIDNTGSINAVTVNGNTTVSNSQDFEVKLRQTTQNGSHNLEMPNVQYGDFSLRTTNGNIDLNLPSSIEPKIDIKNLNGNIEMILGRRLSALIDLKTTNGNVSSNMTVNTSTSVGGVSNKNRLNGMVSSGLGKIVVETKNGNISMNYPDGASSETEIEPETDNVDV